MPIFHWFFKAAQEEQASESTPTNERTDIQVKEAKPKEVVLSKGRQTKQTEITYEASECIAIFLRRGNARAIFHHSLNLTRLGSFRKRNHSSHGAKEELGIMGTKVELSSHVGNKVSPIVLDAHATPISASILTNYQCWSSANKDELKSDTNKALSRMKELWRWAAAVKSDKGGKYIRRKVLHFRNRGVTKASLQDDQWSLSSPKISFRWETESCSTTTSAYSAFSLPSSVSRSDRKWSKPCSSNAAVDVVAPDSSTSTTKDTTVVVQDDSSNESNSRFGSWITTDDEFLVLEL